jgi:hypothetical protein
MGISYSSQTSQQTQNVNNTVLNAATANCDSTCVDYSGGNTVIINGSTINGNISFDQSCSINMSCSINSQLNTNVSNILSAMANQTSTSSNGFPSFSIAGASQNATIVENVTTSVANIINSTCQSTSDIVSQNNFTYLNNSTVNGSLTFAQTGSVNNNCTLNNISGIQVANQVTSSTNQTATFLGSLGLLIILLVVLIIVIGGIFLINFLFKPKSGGGGGGTTIVPEGGGAAGEAGLGAEAAELGPLAAA